MVVVAAALIGGITWNLITWRLGIPSSSSHALIGGLIGLGDRLGRARPLNGPGIFRQGPGAAGRLAGPGLLVGFAVMVLLLNVFRHAHPKRINDRFRQLQLVSAAYMAFSHGSNDAQKTMGIITLALVTGRRPQGPQVPLWVILMAATAISLGTAAGGWRIIKTMGQQVVKLDPVHGFAAETTAATIILAASSFGMPVSTTHVISSRDHRGGLERAVLGGSLGRRRQHRGRLGADDPRVWRGGVARLGSAQPRPLRIGRRAPARRCGPNSAARTLREAQPDDRIGEPQARPPTRFALPRGQQREAGPDRAELLDVASTSGHGGSAAARGAAPRARRRGPGGVGPPRRRARELPPRRRPGSPSRRGTRTTAGRLACSIPAAGAAADWIIAAMPRMLARPGQRAMSGA